MKAQVDVFKDIKEERSRQDATWGPLSDRPHTPQHWSMLMLEELGEAAQRANDGDHVGFVTEVTQLAALAVACLQQHSGGIVRGQVRVREDLARQMIADGTADPEDFIFPDEED